MTDLTTTIDPGTGDTAAVIATALAAATPNQVDLGSVYTAVDSDGNVQVIDLATAEHQKRLGVSPTRKIGHVHLTEHESLSLYVDDHGVAEATELFADRDAGRIVAVLNGHEKDSDEAGWGDHRATLTLRQTPEWKAWTRISGQLADQAEFAEFLEDHLIDIVEPDGAVLLEVATSIQGTTGVAHKSAIRLDNGEVKFRYEETATATAGAQGDLTIPTRITLGIAPFEGVDPYRLTARLRYRIANGALRLGITLDRPDDVLRAAFGDIVEQVSTATGLPVLHGAPA